MSRTYREFPVLVCETCLKETNWKIWWKRFKNKAITTKEFEKYCTCDVGSPNIRASRSIEYTVRKKRDGKRPCSKPPKWFKRIRRRQERAQVKQALHNHVYKGKEFTPPVLNRNSDQWDWT